MEVVIHCYRLHHQHHSHCQNHHQNINNLVVVCTCNDFQSKPLVKQYGLIESTLPKEDNKVDVEFNGMINALSYGAPPHGGIAPGIDRIVMLLANEINIREVTLFPLNQNAQDLLMGAPSEVDEKQLKELNLLIGKKINS